MKGWYVMSKHHEPNSGDRTLSVHTEHEFLLALEKAGLTKEYAQAVISSPENELAQWLMEIICEGSSGTQEIRVKVYDMLMERKIPNQKVAVFIDGKGEPFTEGITNQDCEVSFTLPPGDYSVHIKRERGRSVHIPSRMRARDLIFLI
jgi:hypothetical protein